MPSILKNSEWNRNIVTVEFRSVPLGQVCARVRFEITFVQIFFTSKLFSIYIEPIACRSTLFIRSVHVFISSIAFL